MAFLDISPDVLEPMLLRLVFDQQAGAYVSAANVGVVAKLAPVCRAFYAVVAVVPRMVEISSKRDMPRLPAYFASERNKMRGGNKIQVCLKNADLVCPCVQEKLFHEIALFAPGVHRLHLHNLEMPANLIALLAEAVETLPFLHTLCLSRWRLRAPGFLDTQGLPAIMQRQAVAMKKLVQSVPASIVTLTVVDIFCSGPMFTFMLHNKTSMFSMASLLFYTVPLTHPR
jgi:hypothetical protein